MVNLNGWGTIATDPEIKELPSGVKVCKFTIAQNEFIGKNEDGTSKEISSFFRCELWDTGADYLYNNAKKGDRLAFSGTPRQETWKDKDTGNNREAVYFRINKFLVIKKQQKD